MLPLFVALALCLTPSAPPSGKYWTAASGIELNAAIRAKVDAIAERFHKATRKKLHVTSGVRSAISQARAMYFKVASGGSLGIYKRQDLVKPILDAYREGRRKKRPRDAIIAAMAKVIEGQIADDQLLSRHLSGRAFDVRSNNMTKRMKSAFHRAVRETGGLTVIHERKPPHFHLEILR